MALARKFGLGPLAPVGFRRAEDDAAVALVGGVDDVQAVDGDDVLDPFEAIGTA